MTHPCIFDTTGGEEGYDFISDNFDAAFVSFQDNFTDPDVASSWDATGYVLSASCGTVTGDTALRFRGNVRRYAISPRLPFEYGGRVEFYMIYGSGQVGCATVNLGEVTLSFKPEGGRWMPLETFARATYR